MNATSDADSQGAETAGERTGGCLCGRIRFTTRGPAVFAHTCACPHCQKLGGTPVMWWVGFETVTWTGEAGEPTWYETFPGEAKRGFCPTCVMQAELASQSFVSHSRRPPRSDRCRATRRTSALCAGLSSPAATPRTYRPDTTVA